MFFVNVKSCLFNSENMAFLTKLVHTLKKLSEFQVKYYSRRVMYLRFLLELINVMIQTHAKIERFCPTRFCVIEK